MTALVTNDEPPRVAPGTLRDVGLVNMAIAKVLGRAAGTAGPPNLFTTIGRHRSLFRRWLVFAGALMPGGRLRAGDRELVILRVAHRCGSAYEWDHHERLGRRAGLDATIIEGLRAERAHASSMRHRALLDAVDELHDRRTITEPTWQALRRHFDERETIELCFLVGHYEMLASTLHALGVRPDARLT